MAAYKATARRRSALEKEQLSRRYQQAWDLARRAAALLKERFGVRQVAAFGSLAHEELFHHRSDVDLAVWGLDERRYYRAVGQLLYLDAEISMDLVRIEEARDTLRARIEKEGIILWKSDLGEEDFPSGEE